MGQEAGDRMTLRQVADYLDLTPQRVCQLKGRVDFPHPRVVGFRGATWSDEEIERWAQANPCGRRRWGLRTYGRV
jgi:predicted DNA-binding transcriptional regulator AlpA